MVMMCMYFSPGILTKKKKLTTKIESDKKRITKDGNEKDFIFIIEILVIFLK